MRPCESKAIDAISSPSAREGTSTSTRAVLPFNASEESICADHTCGPCATE